MMFLYTSKAFARDIIAILYYSIVLTGITVFVSAFIGIIQVLSLAQNVAEPEGRFWDGVGVIGDHFEIIGGSICGLFLVIGLGSVMVYKPWRRRMEVRRVQTLQVGDVEIARGPSAAQPELTGPDFSATSDYLEPPGKHAGTKPSTTQAL
jgi:high-affinity nickel-transport protein